MFWLHRHLPAKQALDSKWSDSGYERIIRKILRISGCFRMSEIQMSLQKARRSNFFVTDPTYILHKSCIGPIKIFQKQHTT